jgi:hypothetical protein
MLVEQEISRGADLPGSTDLQLGQRKPSMDWNPVVADKLFKATVESWSLL